MKAKLLAWGRVVRLSLFPSAAADVAAGAVLGAGAWPAGAAPFALIAGSLAVYHGGMALNDWADRDEDRAVRPGRPLPSGALSPASVLAVAAGLLVAGPLLARAAGPDAALALTGVALLAALYDLGPRGPWAGPVLLALCRVGNLGAGLALGLDTAARDAGAGHAIVAALYGVYVLAVSRLGRLEDLPESAPLGRRPARLLATAATALVGAPLAAGLLLGTGGALYALPAVAIAVAAATPLWRASRSSEAWTPARVLPAMGVALRRLLVFTSTAALATGGPAALGVFLAALVGFPASFALRRVFPPS